ncbi:hypothetical protein ES703_123970 [subsurface metagenome]
MFWLMPGLASSGGGEDTGGGWRGGWLVEGVLL